MIDPATLKILTKLFPIEEYAAYNNDPACNSSKHNDQLNVCWRKGGHTGPPMIWRHLPPYKKKPTNESFYVLDDVWD